MKNIYIGLIISLLSTTNYAQVADLEWANALSGTNHEFGYSIVTDDAGNVYVTGTFLETVDFDPSIDDYFLTSNGNYDVFVQKMDANGNFIWAKSFGGASVDRGYSIDVDALGNVYVTGEFQADVDFNPNSGIFNLSSNGSSDAFIQKLDANGNFVWAKSIGGPSNESGNSIFIDRYDDVYVTGSFKSTVVDFDPSNATFDMITNGDRDIFIEKLDGEGNFIWAKSFGGPGYDHGNSITADSYGNVFVTGYFSQTVTFDPSSPAFTLNSKGLEDVYVLKINSKGEFEWVNSAGGSGYDNGNSITTDVYGNVVVVGSFRNSVDFDPGADPLILTSNGDTDGFVQKLNTYGNLIWAKAIGGTEADVCYSVATDMNSNIIISGYYKGSVDFYQNPIYPELISNGGKDIFIEKLDDKGAVIWAASMGESMDDESYAVTTDFMGNPHATGYFNATVDFDPNSGLFELTSLGLSEVFIQKLDQASATAGISGNEALNSVSIFPNPSKGIVNIDMRELDNTDIKVFAMDGQLVYHKENITSATYQFELKNAPGSYIIEVSSLGENKHYKLIKK